MLFVLLDKKNLKTDPDNYCGVSLIYPIGHLFSKIATNFLECDNNMICAACQLGFCILYGIEDNILIL